MSGHNNSSSNAFASFKIARVELFSEPVVDRSQQFARLLHLALITPQPRHAFLAEPFLSAPNHRLGLASGPQYFGSAVSIGQKDNPRSPNVLLWAVAIGHHRLKLTAVGGTQSNVRSLVHSSDCGKRRRCHTFAACPIASRPVEKWRRRTPPRYAALFPHAVTNFRP
jgi:hypothetical protein